MQQYRRVNIKLVTANQNGRTYAELDTSTIIITIIGIVRIIKKPDVRNRSLILLLRGGNEQHRLI